MLAAVVQMVPRGWYLMTKNAHEEDNSFTEQTVAAKNIHYFENKLCKEGEPNGRALTIFRQSVLNQSYVKYIESTGNKYPLQSLTALGKCRALHEDDQ